MDSRKPPDRLALKATPTAREYRDKRFDAIDSKRKEAREELLWARRDPDGSFRRNVSTTGWKNFLDKGIAERRNDVAGMNLRRHTAPTGMSPFIYDLGTSSGTVDHQVKYGPAAQLGKTEMSALHTHYGSDVGPRLTQYSSERSDYAKAAKASGRPLTLQEHDVSQGKDPGSASINHLIASGTGQNLLNRMTLQFNKGKEELETAKGLSTMTDVRKGALKGLAMQAAAVGRMTGMGRAILAEEHPDAGYGKTLSGTDAAQKAFSKRAMMKQDVLKSFEGATSTVRHESYKQYMKNTFDSFGNLRLGQGQGNGRVSTGFDMPLNSSGQPTQRGMRLLDTMQTFGLPDMQVKASVANHNYKSGKSTTIRTGVYTVNTSGKFLSSSKEK